MADVPGGSSGLLVKTYKGKDAATAVYKFDAALVKGLRETCKQVAIEIGQWAEKRNVTLTGDLGVRILAARKRMMEREAAHPRALGVHWTALQGRHHSRQTVGN